MNLFNLMATLTLDDKGYNSAIDSAEKKAGGFAQKAGTFASGAVKAVGAISTAVAGAISAVGAVSMSSAMELEASEAKYKTVFDGFTEQSDAFIKEFQKLTPATTAEARNMASGLQDLLKPMGFATDEATNMTGELMHLVGALTNFNSGTETAESVSAKFSGALTGELSGLKSLGIQLDDQTVRQKAVEMGLAKTTSEVDKQAMAQVIIQEAYKQSTDALTAYNEESLDAKTKMQLFTKQLADTGAQIGQKFLPLLNEGLGSLKSGFENLIPAIDLMSNGLLDMINGVEGGAEKFKTGITDLLTNLVKSINDLLPAFMDIALQIVFAVVDTILANLPMLLKTGIDILISLINGIAQSLPELIPVMVDTLLTMVDTLVDNIDMIVDAGINLIIALVEGLINALPILIEKAPVIINKFWDAIERQFPKILKLGIDLLVMLGKGIIQSIPVIIANAGEIVSAILRTIMGINLFKSGATLIKNLAGGLKSMLGSLGSTMKGIGDDLVKGLWNGIKNAGSWLKDKIFGFGDDIIKSVKGVFGIKSPSRVFRDEIGEMLGQGLEIGFSSSMEDANKTIENEVSHTVDLASDAVDANGTSATGGIVFNQVINSKSVLSPLEMAQEAINAQRRLRWELG